MISPANDEAYEWFKKHFPGIEYAHHRADAAKVVTDTNPAYWARKFGNGTMYQMVLAWLAAHAGEIK